MQIIKLSIVFHHQYDTTYYDDMRTEYIHILPILITLVLRSGNISKLEYEIVFTNVQSRMKCPRGSIN